MMENEISIITSQWISWLNDIEPGKQIEIPAVNREIVALYIALQFLRTADIRDILSALSPISELAPERERRKLHTYMLWNQETVDLISNRVRDSTWIFGRNSTSTPFLTSDNPVAFRTSNNAIWLKTGVISDGAYVVFPLSPHIVMYCHPKKPPSEKLAKFDACLSPVWFTTGMVQSENSGQVSMASRFVISQVNAFDDARDFARTIGTEHYARK